MMSVSAQSNRDGVVTLSAGTEELLDPGALEHLACLPADRRQSLEERIFRTFDRVSLSLIKQIELAHAQDNFALMQASAHSMKSSAGQVGALPLARLADQLEKLAPKGGIIDGHIAEILECHRRTASAVESRLSP